MSTNALLHHFKNFLLLVALALPIRRMSKAGELNKEQVKRRNMSGYAKIVVDCVRTFRVWSPNTKRPNTMDHNISSSRRSQFN